RRRPASCSAGSWSRPPARRRPWSSPCPRRPTSCCPPLGSPAQKLLERDATKRHAPEGKGPRAACQPDIGRETRFFPGFLAAASWNPAKPGPPRSVLAPRAPLDLGRGRQRRGDAAGRADRRLARPAGPVAQLLVTVGAAVVAEHV